MSSSWNSPFLPAQPNPTPVTTSKRAALRPPIHNPYDKFTQPEFDAWIGDITGALRKALKMEPEEAEAPVVDEKRDALARADAEEERERDEGDRIPQADHEVVHHGDIVEDDDGSEAFEDSFAHITSRKAKGKARDPREGPGLGNINHPVELKSASEVEEEESGSEEEWQRELRGDDEEEGEQEYSYDEDAEDEDQGEEEDDEWQGFRTFGGQSSDHAIELLSDDDDEEEAEKTSVRVHVERVVSDAEEDEDESEDGEEDEEGSVEEVAQPATVEEDVNEPAPAAVFPDDEEEPLDEPVTPVEILDPWVGPKTYAEDFYSGGDLVAPVAAGLTPNNMTPADMSPIVEAAGDDQDNNPTADFMLPSPSPEIIDVDADEDEPENESLPRSSPPPADAEDEFDELYADIDENFASSPPTKHAAPAPPSSGLPPTNITDSDRIELAALEADHHAQRPLEQHSDWEWDASSTRSGRAHVVDDFPTEEAFGYGGNYDNVEDDEDADTGAFGALPLGTSDLDLPETWGVDADLDVDEEEPMPQLLYEVFESPDPSVRVKVYDDLVDIEETQSAGGQDVLLGEVESVADVTRAPSVALFDVVDLDEVAAAAFQQFAEAQGNEPEADSAFSPRASAIIELQDEDSFGELPMTPSPEDGLDEQTQQTEEFFSGFEGTTEPMPTLDTADVLATIEALGTANEESLSAKYKAWVSEELEGSSEADQEVQDVAETTPVQAEGRISETNEVQPPVDEPETLNIEEPGNSAEEDQEAYSVEEVEAELVLEDDADALADDGFNDVASVSAEELGDAIPAIVKYIVEDIMTEGRQTEEPEGPIVTITIDESFNAEESPDIIVFDFTDEPEPDEGLADIEPTLETLPMDDEDAAASHVPQKKVTIDTDLDDIIPAPISADPTVPDPTSRPHTPELGRRG
ncbi:hypothetical protein EVG20_g2579 [Dentipellis fragilis]|uniref:Uncharacterized protein n=1 Tax=Dentipellis fragilis TaxID=205917 RepID=A0A4Y9Z8S7_9AGAM|nr:hypothetical protein EVG20_g2579 [Dentipellis fragilis]